MPPVGLKGSTLNRVLANERALTARLIAERPTIITVRRAGVDLSPQTVFIDYSLSAAQRFGVNVAVSRGSIIVLGYKGDPNFVNTLLAREDRFYVQADDAVYDVVQIIPGTRANLLAVAEVSEGT